ncbi:endonuclease/exonuclease/phosphatase family protein [Amycolatopsis kentuckyensis]|uniref:endonuclease/exonuclease/phosphatase family protein n=1 Tax=Amycolatopsis kentuckyensis TaxID=218823 RepID=UPI000A3D10BC|nr:endonuclease/exonuclease/phosphatase family protein [Amycolatopsis kentuckyensis]
MTAETLEEPEQPLPPRPARWCVATRVLVGLAAAWLLFTVAYVLFTGDLWVWLLPGLLPPLAFLVGPAVVALGLAVPRLLRRRVPKTAFRLVLVLAVAALVAGAGRSGINVAALGGGEGAAPAGAPTVVAWNTEYWDQTDDPDRFYAYLHAHPADIYLLQEYVDQVGTDGARDADDLARLRAEFPGYHLVARGELLTLSRYPVLDRPRVGPDRGVPDSASYTEVFESAKVLRTDLQVGSSVLTVYNVHLPVQVDVTRNPLSPGFYSYVHARDGLRKAQLAGLAEDVAANPNPLLVAGDFNTSPAMGDLDGLRGALVDAGRASSSLYPGSWPASAPLWRLDWTLTTPGVRVHDYRFDDPAGLSDHELQRTRISLAGGR